jgi:hypothetical protein
MAAQVTTCHLGVSHGGLIAAVDRPSPGASGRPRRRTVAQRTTGSS